MRATTDNWTAAAEQRAHPRQSTARKAYLVNGRQAYKCSLIDIADGGARISIAGVVLPEEGAILVDARARQVHLTRVVWRSQKEAGLQFLHTGPMDGPAGGLAGALTIATRFAWGLNAREGH